MLCHMLNVTSFNVIVLDICKTEDTGYSQILRVKNGKKHLLLQFYSSFLYGDFSKTSRQKNITSSELKQIKIFVYSRKYSRKLRDYCSFQLKLSTTLKRYDHYLATIVEFEMPSKCSVKISWIIFCDKYFSVLLLLYQCHI